MSGLLSLAQASIAGFALHALWQVPLLGSAAWLAIRVGKPKVRVAHVIWSISLALCVLMPLVATVAGRRAALAAERASQDASVRYGTTDYIGPLPAMQREPLWLRLFHRHVTTRGLQPFSFALSNGAERGVAAIYLLIASGLLLQLALAWRRSARLVKIASTEALPRAVNEALRKRCAMLQIDEPSVRMSEEIAGPALAGVRRPTLLLPAGMARQMSDREIDAVLAHELSHLRRRDPLMHALSSLLVIPIGFHPAALWVARRVRQTREMACDADAAAQMGSSAQYAHALLQVAERTGGGPVHATGLGLFTTGLGFLGTSLELFGAGGAMEERMETLMHGRDAANSRLRMGVGIGLAAVTILAAAMVQVQPALAAEHAASAASAPQLIGGDHALGQLRDAQRRLDDAEERATTDEERSRIATARSVARAAEDQIAAASGQNHVGSAERGLDSLHAQLDALNQQLESPEWKAQMQRQLAEADAMRKQFDSPEWKAQIEKQRIDAEKMRKQFDSPEWRAQMERQRADAEKQRVEAEKLREKFNSPEWKAQIAQAEKMRVMAIRQLNDMQMQIAATPSIARLEMLVPPVAAVSPADQDGKAQKVDAHVMAGNKLHGDNPVYPAEAKEKHIQGAVLLHAIIGESGAVESLQVISAADPLLAKSSLEAVRTWVYKPYLLNGNPTAVDTTITVNFSLAN